jgi:hypothetical protein
MGYPVLFEPYRILETVDFDVLRIPDFTNLKGYKVAYENLTGLEPGIIKSVNRYYVPRKSFTIAAGTGKTTSVTPAYKHHLTN